MTRQETNPIILRSNIDIIGAEEAVVTYKSEPPSTSNCRIEKAENRAKKEKPATS
jgi:hypothetical protein